MLLLDEVLTMVCSKTGCLGLGCLVRKHETKHAGMLLPSMAHVHGMLQPLQRLRPSSRPQAAQTLQAQAAQALKVQVRGKWRSWRGMRSYRCS